MLMKTCEVTKHIAVGRKSQNMFLRIGTEHVSSMSNIVTVGLPKRINLLESLASDFRNTTFSK